MFEATARYNLLHTRTSAKVEASSRGVGRKGEPESAEPTTCDRVAHQCHTLLEGRDSSSEQQEGMDAAAAENEDEADEREQDGTKKQPR